MIGVVLVIQRLDEMRGKTKLTETTELAGYSEVKRVVFLMKEKINARERIEGFGVQIFFCPFSLNKSAQSYKPII